MCDNQAQAVWASSQEAMTRLCSACATQEEEERRILIMNLQARSSCRARCLIDRRHGDPGQNTGEHTISQKRDCGESAKREKGAAGQLRIMGRRRACRMKGPDLLGPR